LVLAAIAAHESGWGRSRIAKEKNNLAGLGAYDHSPGSAIRFESREECVMFLAELLRDRPGESLEEIGWWYASDPRWAAKAGRCMKIIAEAGQ
jgi:beta-N-acetylglucosaminidase